VAYIAVTFIKVEEDVVHYTRLMLEKVVGYRAWCTHTHTHTHCVIKTDQLTLTKDVMPVLRMRESFLIHSLEKYKDFIILA